VQGRFAEINPDAIGQSLQFTVSDKAAAAATVLLIPWPLNPQADFPAFFDGEAGDDGRFSIAGLPPGSYHALAVSASAWSQELQKPAILAALTAGAKEITLVPVATQDLSLDLSYVALQ
jgi:hypothetical protein